MYLTFLKTSHAMVNLPHASMLCVSNFILA